ncbi:MAG: hypothetical protein JWO03_2736 [Bacteroidetes bacterium]|nr:hypothetical protein [Bacteroidota bacterium]
MAFILGALLPALETVRRQHQILVPEFFFRWIDDYILGAVLLAAAVIARKNKSNSVQLLIAAWGIAAGALAASLLGQLDFLVNGMADAGVFSSVVVTIAKAAILVYIIIGLMYSIKAGKERPA